LSTARNKPTPSHGRKQHRRSTSRGGPAGPQPGAARAPAGKPTDWGQAAQKQAPLAGYEVLVCISGGIAAYKVAVVVSQLVQLGCGVTVALTCAGRRFVGEVTFRGLTGRPVYTDESMWETGGQIRMGHLSLTEAADLVVVAPATANILGKLAGGIADDMVSTLLIGADSPVLLAPAMNERMWRHPAVQRNAAWLREAGFLLVGPEEGWLACGAIGPGRMSEPEVLVGAIREQLLKAPPKRRASGGAEIESKK
jgi:phosphopantothenoylcysteine decarboxylase/phosphopantothenate--cysteine ligase